MPCLSCPLIGYPCRQRRCAWWDEKTGCCANLAVVHSLHKLSVQIENLKMAISSLNEEAAMQRRKTPSKAKVGKTVSQLAEPQ